MAVGEQVTLTIERMGQSGDGVARIPDGRLAFVEGALPGEVVDAVITEERKNFVRADGVARNATSAERIDPVCPLFGACGGCTFQHWDYRAELRYKEAWVREALRRTARQDPALIDTIRGARNPYGYRNKGQFPFGGRPGEVTLGLFRRGTHEVIPAAHCDIQDEWVNGVLAAATAAANRVGLEPYDETQHAGVLRHLLIRTARASREALVLIVVHANDPKIQGFAEDLAARVPYIRGVGVNINPERTNRILGRTTRVLVGSPTIFDTILDLQFRLSFTSFFQVNPQQVAVLYEAALGFLPSDCREVWDLYSGVGTLAALAATKAQTVRALEVNVEAVKDAEANFQLNQLQNIVIEVGRAEELMAEWVKGREAPPDAVIMDPPRAGLDPEVIRQIGRLSPRRIIYISCNPDTWARDLAALWPQYRLERAVPVDMFPRTDHVEVASYLSLV